MTKKILKLNLETVRIMTANQAQTRSDSVHDCDPPGTGSCDDSCVCGSIDSCACKPGE